MYISTSDVCLASTPTFEGRWKIVNSEMMVLYDSLIIYDDYGKKRR